MSGNNGRITEYCEIACQQVLEEDNSVFSVQWAVVADKHAGGITPEMLMTLYLEYIRQATLSFVRPSVTDKAVEFRLLGTDVSLLEFRPPIQSCVKHGTGVYP